MSEKLRLLTHACVLAGLCCLAGAARAQSAAAHGIELRWERSTGAELCIASTDVAQRVEQRLGRVVFSSASEPILVIDGRVEPGTEHGFRAAIQISGPDGTLFGSRELSVPDADCRKLDEVLTLIISVTLRNEASGGSSLPVAIASQLKSLLEGEPPTQEPARASTPDEPEPAAAASDVEPSAPASAPRIRSTSESAESSWRAQIEAGFGVMTGVAPALTFAPLVRAQLQLRKRYSLALEARLGLLQAERVADESRGSLEYRSSTVALIACFVPLSAAKIELAVCVDGRLGNLSVRAVDFLQSYSASQLWIELAPAVSLRVSLLGRTFAHLRAAAPWRATRPRFQYEDSQGDVRDAFTVAPLGVDLSLGVGVEF